MLSISRLPLYGLQQYLITLYYPSTFMPMDESVQLMVIYKYNSFFRINPYTLLVYAKFLSVTGLRHFFGMIHPLYGLGRFEPFLGWIRPLYGLVILIQRVVKPVHFMDSTSDYPLRGESIHFVDYKQLEIILYGMSPSTMWISNFNSMCYWTCPLYGLNFRSPPRGWVCPLCGL